MSGSRQIRNRENRRDAGKRIRLSSGKDGADAAAMRLRKETELNSGDGSAPPDLTGCLMTQLMTPRPNNTMPLPVPPGREPYWVKVEVNPMQVQASIQ